MAAITSYSTLATAITDYLARSELNTFVANFVQNCESRIYKNLRIRAMENQLSAAISGGVATIPEDYVELKYAYVDTSPVQSLDRVPGDQIYALYPVRSGSAEIPQLIATEGDNFIFGPYPGDYTVKGVYYGRLTALSTSNETNWFTTNAPDLLLYGSLIEAEPFLRNDKRMPVWQELYDRAFFAVQNEEKRQRSSGGSIATRRG